MRKTVWIVACALLASSGAVQAQASKAPAPQQGVGQPGGPQGPNARRPLFKGKQDRWNRLLNAASVMAREGGEVGRISQAEGKQIADFVAATRTFIANSRQGGLTEAEEDAIDNNIAAMFKQIAASMTN